MKEKISLEDVLGCSPEQTYLGSTYAEDIYSFLQTTFSLETTPSLETEVGFVYSAVERSTHGFHFSAVNVHTLVPLFSAMLAKHVLAAEQKEVTQCSLTFFEQKYSKLILTHPVHGQVQLMNRTDQDYILEYAFGLPPETAMFSGRIQLHLDASPALYPLSVPLAIPLPAEPSHYSLHDAQYNEARKSVSASLRSSSLEPEKIHAAASQLLRVLMCQLLQVHRGDIIEAMAYKVSTQYHRNLAGFNGETRLTLDVDKNMFQRESGGRLYAFGTCHYTFGEDNPYVTSTMQVACPLDRMPPEKKELMARQFQILKS